MKISLPPHSLSPSQTLSSPVLTFLVAAEATDTGRSGGRVGSQRWGTKSPLHKDGAGGQQGATWRRGAGDLGYSGEDGAVVQECRRMANEGGAGELLQGGAVELRHGELRRGIRSSSLSNPAPRPCLRQASSATPLLRARRQQHLRQQPRNSTSTLSPLAAREPAEEDDDHNLSPR